MSINTTTTNLQISRSSILQKEVLENLLPALRFDLFARQFHIPENSGTRTAKWMRVNEIETQAVPDVLGEGITPAGDDIDLEYVEATLSDYGRYVTITDVVKNSHEIGIVDEVKKKVGNHAAIHKNRTTRNYLDANGSAAYAGSASSVATVATEWVIGDVRDVVTELESSNVPKVSDMVNHSTGIGSSPLDEAYICITHPHNLKALYAISGFVRPHEYGSQSAKIPGEIGYVDGVRFISSTECSITISSSNAAVSASYRRDAGGKAHVYANYVFGSGWYGGVGLGAGEVSGLSEDIKTGKVKMRQYKTKGIEIITTPMEASDSDPLKQRMKIGYKHSNASRILQPSAGYVFYTAALA